VLKFCRPWAKGVQNSDEKVGVFVTDTTKFFVAEQMGMKYGQETIGVQLF